MKIVKEVYGLGILEEPVEIYYVIIGEASPMDEASTIFDTNNRRQDDIDMGGENFSGGAAGARMKA